MGAKHSLEDDLITFRLTSKQMARNAKKCEENAKKQEKLAAEAMKKGNIEGARIYTSNVIREKNQSLNMLKLGSRIDSVAARLETAIRMQDLSKAMSSTVKGMSNVMKSMEVDKIAATMENFEKAFEDMDVKSGYMEGAIDATTSMTTPPEQVDALLEQIAAANGLEVGNMLDNAGTLKNKNVNPATEQVQAPAADDLEARLRALRDM
jgi:charged multivesicular body protein 1